MGGEAGHQASRYPNPTSYHNLNMSGPKRQKVRHTSRALVRTVTAPRYGTKYRIKKSLKWNGEVAFTRTATGTLNLVESQGFAIGGTNFPAIAFVYDPTGVTVFGSAIAFTVLALPNAAEIAALWDRVFIEKVKITIDHIAQRDSSGGLTACPKMLICNDPNNGGTGTSVSAIKEHTDCRPLYGDGPWVHTCYPKHQRLVYYTAATSSFEPTRGYVNADTAIPHYATFLGLEIPGLTAATYMSLTFQFFLRCKDVK